LNTIPEKTPEDQIDVSEFIKAYESGRDNGPLKRLAASKTQLAGRGQESKITHALSKLEAKRSRAWTKTESLTRLNVGVQIGLVVSLLVMELLTPIEDLRSKDALVEVGLYALGTLESAIEMLEGPYSQFALMKSKDEKIQATMPKKSIADLRNWLEAVRPDEWVRSTRNRKNQFKAGANDRRAATTLSRYFDYLLGDPCTSETAAFVSALTGKTIRARDVYDWVTKDPNSGSLNNS